MSKTNEDVLGNIAVTVHEAFMCTVCIGKVRLVVQVGYGRVFIQWLHTPYVYCVKCLEQVERVGREIWKGLKTCLISIEKTFLSDELFSGITPSFESHSLLRDGAIFLNGGIQKTCEFVFCSLFFFKIPSLVQALESQHCPWQTHYLQMT